VTRVLLLHQPIDGGVARHVIDLFEGLRLRGCDAILAGPAVPSASLLTRSARADVSHVQVPLERAVAPVADVVALGRYSQVLRQWRPDLVHAHSSKAGGIARLGRALHPRIPVIYTPHGYSFAGFFDHEVERSAYRQAERAMARLACFLVAVCEAEGRLAQSVGPASRVRVVHNGIEAAPDGPGDPDVLKLRRRGPVIATVTQLRPGKGVETLIDAVPPIVARHPTVQVAIAGDGPLRPALEQRVRARGVERSVSFLGEHADPLAVLRATDIFVLASWAEAFPYVILEAMSVGLPIVSSDVGGIREAIAHRESGLLVPAADPQATSRALLELLDDRELRRRCGEVGHRVVTERFTRAAMVAGVVGVYEEALRGVRCRPRTFVESPRP
jgi:glycosyltransferase involved in cell wall biosynthesis